MGSRFPLQRIEQNLTRTLWPYQCSCSVAQDGSMIIHVYDPDNENTGITLLGIGPEHYTSAEQLHELEQSIQQDLDALLSTLDLAPTRERYLHL